MSSEDKTTGVTNLLRSLPGAQDELYELVYGHLKAIANKRLASENRAQTFQATALVNEAYLKLAKQKSAWRDRRHFYGVAAEAMRRILIDAARSRNADKRGGKVAHVPLTGISLPDCEWESDMLGLDTALNELENKSPEHAEIVRLKFFSGLTIKECAELLEVSVTTIERRWRFAKVWLRSKIQEFNEG